jgi:hypothetical protein
MTLIDWLRKLGILRFGGETAVYRNAKDRPLGLQMDGVLDSKKDVIDIGRKGKTQPGAGEAKQ